MTQDLYTLPLYATEHTETLETTPDLYGVAIVIILIAIAIMTLDTFRTILRHIKEA